MEFEVLGPLRVRAGAAQAPLTAQMPRTLLGILLCRANTSVSVDVLVDALWGGRPDPGAGKKLQLHVHRLRKALGERDRIRFENSGYLLRVSPGELDVERFETLLAEAADAAGCGEPGRGAELYRKALGLWRGQPYGDLADVPLLRAEADRLAERWLTTLEELYAAELACGRHVVVVPELGELAAAHPLRERLQELLMLALYRAGRQADALGVYRRTRRVLVEELGVEPGPQLQRLERAILRADPALEPAGEPAPAAPVRPAQLPADITDFTGREAQLAMLRRHLTGGGERPRTVVISAIAGRAGVGKTSLAVHTAHRLRDEFPDGQLYVNLRGAEANPLDPAEVLARFLRALGVDGSAIPENVDERAAMYRSLLADHRMLVLLDNAATEAQVRPLLPGAAGCAVLVTSRARLAGLDGVRLVDLDVLTPVQAVDLLDRIAGEQRVAAEPQAAMEIAARCGYLPLAVRIAGARLAARAHWPLARLAARLADEHRRLDELRLADLEVRASLALSYGGLDPTARRAFRRLGIFDAPDFAAWVAAAVLDIPVADAAPVIERLVDAQLLDIAGEDDTGQARYRFHDLLRVYARERLQDEEGVAERTAALTRALGAALALAEQASQLLLGPGHRRRRGGAPRWELDQPTVETLLAAPYAWFEAERLSLVTAVDQAAAAGMDELAWELASALTFFLDVRGYLGDWWHINEQVLMAMRRADNRRGQGVTLYGLGRLHHLADHYDDALRLLHEGMTAFRETGDRQGEAEVSWSLGETYRVLGRRAESARWLERALTRYRELDDELGVAHALERVALVELDADRLVDAQIHLDEALATFRRLAHQRGEGVSLRWLGLLRRKQGRLAEATSLLRESVTLFDRLNDHHSRALAMQNLGEVHAAQGLLSEARAVFERCLQGLRDHADRHSEARALLNLGELHAREARTDQAVACLESSLRIWSELGLASWREQALRALMAAQQAR